MWYRARGFLTARLETNLPRYFNPTVIRLELFAAPFLVSFPLFRLYHCWPASLRKFYIHFNDPILSTRDEQ